MSELLGSTAEGVAGSDLRDDIASASAARGVLVALRSSDPGVWQRWLGVTRALAPDDKGGVARPRERLLLFLLLVTSGVVTAGSSVLVFFRDGFRILVQSRRNRNYH